LCFTFTLTQLSLVAASLLSIVNLEEAPCVGSLCWSGQVQLLQPFSVTPNTWDTQHHTTCFVPLDHHSSYAARQSLCRDRASHHPTTETSKKRFFKNSSSTPNDVHPSTFFTIEEHNEITYLDFFLSPVLSHTIIQKLLTPKLSGKPSLRYLSPLHTTLSIFSGSIIHRHGPSSTPTISHRSSPRGRAVCHRS
jgi:hypothetical protein